MARVAAARTVSHVPPGVRGSSEIVFGVESRRVVSISSYSFSETIELIKSTEAELFERF